MAIPGNAKVIPNFLVAQSPRGLRRLMLRNNLKNAKQYDYYKIFQANDGRWYAWYEEVEKVELNISKEGEK